jgi:enterochelin esterase-like enzyme
MLALGTTALAQMERAANPSIPHGTVRHYVYRTEVAIHLPGNREDYYVYTPPGYVPASSKSYPVLYLLHGDNQGASAWLRSGRVSQVLDSLIARGEARPMIVVMPRGYGDEKFLRAGIAIWGLPQKVDENTSLFSQMLLNEIIPKIESSYVVSQKREDHAIVGLSMGGLEAISIGFQNAERFGWIGGFSAAIPKDCSQRLADSIAKPDKFKLVWIAYGVSDYPYVVNGNRRLISELKERGFKVTQIDTPGRHEWPVWSYDFRQLAPLLFK